MENKKLIYGFLVFFVIVSIGISGCIQTEKTPDEYCIKTETGEKLSLSEARQIASESVCVENGTLKETYLCNNATGTWWIDLDIEKEGCNPACVVNAATKQADINWRCTGVLPPKTEKEQACINSGGTVKTGMCCKSAGDFPNLCLIGACGCAPKNSHEVKICDCGEGKCFDGSKCVPEINNFDDCIKAGYPVMESYPRQCRTPDGRTFTEEISLCASDDECVPAACCHPSECVHESQAPDCEGVACTMECRQGTMDCGYGHCACIDKKCQVVWAEEEGEGQSCSGMTLEEAEQIAIDSECGDQLKDTQVCNPDTGTWWIDLDIEKEGCNPACVVNIETKTAEINWRCTGVITEEGGKDCVTDDDCVVFGKTGDCNCGCYNKDDLPLGAGGECFCQAPDSCKCVNGKCEGVFTEELKINSFEECVAAGNPVLESYPRQCKTPDGKTFTEESCQSKGDILTLEDARQIAIESECGDQLKDTQMCNPDTGTWWIDLDIEKEGCNPACVVNLATRTAEINWRCTGALPPEIPEIPEEFCIKNETGENLSLSEAIRIASESVCLENGTLKETYFCNNVTGTWWIDLDIEKEGCNPACVINVATKQAEINWRCTGALPPI